MTTSYTCMGCRAPVGLDDTHCKNCGASLRGVRCQRCGYLGSEVDFLGGRCPNCAGPSGHEAGPQPAPTLASCAAVVVGLLLALSGFVAGVAGMARFQKADFQAGLSFAGGAAALFGLLGVLIWWGSSGGQAVAGRVARKPPCALVALYLPLTGAGLVCWLVGSLWVAMDGEFKKGPFWMGVGVLALGLAAVIGWWASRGGPQEGDQ